MKLPDTSTESEDIWLSIAAYASLAHALPVALEGGGFVAESLATQLAADFARPIPPLPSSPLDDDPTLNELLAALPQRLRRDLQVDWKRLGEKGGDRAACLFRSLAGCDESPLRALDPLGDCLAGHLSDTLVERSGLAVDMARYLAAEARNEAILCAVEHAPLDRIESYMGELATKGLISGERVLVYARRGNSPIFHAALGHCAALDAEMVAAFIEDGGLRVLERILLRTDFAPVMQQTILATFAEAARLA